MSGICGYLGRLQDEIGGDSAALLRRMGERMAAKSRRARYAAPEVCEGDAHRAGAVVDRDR